MPCSVRTPGNIAAFVSAVSKIICSQKVKTCNTIFHGVDFIHVYSVSLFCSIKKEGNAFKVLSILEFKDLDISMVTQPKY